MSYHRGGARLLLHDRPRRDHPKGQIMHEHTESLFEAIRTFFSAERRHARRRPRVTRETFVAVDPAAVRAERRRVRRETRTARHARAVAARRGGARGPAHATVH
ncbi:hypothetical protein A8L33_02540 [Microbacterium aurantiacum]|uniref:Uncharacterized protein n=2 Tax=Microbacterium aurantiacum TaxID=162393 RepID=A0A0M8MFW8_9MICO|nr:hypothetical protein A8L33_02540 [Microbacterium chocolatum]KOS11656.1 hypothetical protein XI38_03660 [Microbacterium chocolatum]